MTGRSLFVVAVPVSAVRPTLEAARASFTDDVAVLSLAKGLELGSLKRVDEIIAEAACLPPERIAVLSGPNLSREIAERHPTATVVGTEMAGATKNVIAVAIGAAEGMGLGINTRSTLITRGLAEMTRLGIALGADASTFAGLSGIGDLVATCSSRLSRNFSLGHRLGSGMPLAEARCLGRAHREGRRVCRRGYAHHGRRRRGRRGARQHRRHGADAARAPAKDGRLEDRAGVGPTRECEGCI